MRKKVFMILLGLILILPLLTMNLEEDQVSQLDNRPLTTLDRKKGEEEEIRLPIDFSQYSAMFEDYLSDRIGFREEMLSLYGNGFNSLFHVLKHANYEYGVEDEVHYKFTEHPLDRDFVERFYNYLGVMDRYLDTKGIDFVFAMNPSKNDIYPETVPDDVHISYRNMNYLRQLMSNHFVTYVDNIEFFQNLETEERIFNHQYDTGHWTDYGAVLGIENMIAPFREKHPEIGEISLEKLEREENVEPYLPNSKIRIDEPVINYVNPNYQSIYQGDYVNDLHRNIKIHPIHRNLDIRQNPNNPDAPKLLIFRGSFMNHKDEFYSNAFSEVIGIHNYENIFDLDYYLNLFKPDMVLFEVAASAFSTDYFSRSGFKARYSLPHSFYDSLVEYSSQPYLEDISIEMIPGDTLVNFVATYPENFDTAYFTLEDIVNDTHPVDNGDGTYTAYTAFYANNIQEGTKAYLELIDDTNKMKIKVPIDL